MQRKVALTAFDLTDEGPVQAAGDSQLFLALAAFAAASSDALTKGLRRW